MEARHWQALGAHCGGCHDAGSMRDDAADGADGTFRKHAHNPPSGMAFAPKRNLDFLSLRTTKPARERNFSGRGQSSGTSGRCRHSARKRLP